MMMKRNPHVKISISLELILTSLFSAISDKLLFDEYLPECLNENEIKLDFVSFK